MATALAGRETRTRWRSAVGRQAGTVVLAALALWFLGDRIASIDPSAVISGLARIPAPGWLGAVALTAISFAAIGRYDASVHDLLGTCVPQRPAARAGMAAIAVAQTTGIGLVSGTLVRWRLLPDLGLAGAGRVTVAVTGSFLLAWVVLTAFVIAAFAPIDPGLRLAAGLSGAGALASALIFLPRLAIGPAVSRPWLLRVLGWTAVDLTAAALALWVLVPDAAGFQAVFPAYLLALGAGLVAGTPAGIGPFELVLLSLLPGPDPEGLLAAALAFRVTYYVLPALTAAAALTVGAAGASPATRLRAPAAVDFDRAERSEAGLGRQGHLLILTGSDLLVGNAGPVLAAVGDPLSGPDSRLLPAQLASLAAHARDAGRIACLYKAGARTAAGARAAGWRVLRIADEMVVDPGRFVIDGPARSGLRRKLRHASRSGVVVSLHAPADPSGLAPPMPVLGRISRDWARAHGGERGFSMGRFAPDYLGAQQICIAWHRDRPVAFASFHVNAREWTLDLMRAEAGVPDGTMQAIVASAIAEAARIGIPRLSLAAVPTLPAGAIAGGVARLPAGLRARLTATGLRQFKASFAPRHEPRYLVAPGRLGLAIAALSLAWAIRRPARIPAPSRDESAGARPDPWPRVLS